MKTVQKIFLSIAEQVESLVGNRFDVQIIVTDQKKQEVCAGQIGKNFEQPFKPIAALLSSGELSVLRQVFAYFPKDILPEFKAVIEELMEDAEESQEPEGTGKAWCSMCRHFKEKSHGFGCCKYHNADFDGEQPNGNIINGGCSEFSI